MQMVMTMAKGQISRSTFEYLNERTPGTIEAFFCQTLSFLGLFQIQSLSEQKRIYSESRFSKCSLQIQSKIELMS